MLDALDFRARREIDNSKSVETAHLHEDPLRRSVGIGRECHRPDAQVHLQRPCGRLGTGVDHVDRSPCNRSGHHVLAVRSDVGIVDGTPRRDRLDHLHRRGVHDIDAARLGVPDGDVHAPAVATHGHVVRMGAQLDLVSDLQRPGVDDIERAVGLVGDVDAAAVRRGAGAVVHLDPLDHADDGVGGRVDQVDVVSGAVGLDDPDLVLRRERHRAQRGGGHDRQTPAKRASIHHCRHLLVRRSYRAVCPRTQALSVSHSGSFCEAKCLPPLW